MFSILRSLCLSLTAKDPASHAMGIGNALAALAAG
jgi:hypothetical protein